MTYDPLRAYRIAASVFFWGIVAVMAVLAIRSIGRQAIESPAPSSLHVRP